LGVDDRAGGIAIDRLVASKHRWGPAVHTRRAHVPNLSDQVAASVNARGKPRDSDAGSTRSPRVEQLLGVFGSIGLKVGPQ
jgi:hypothetical protein